nr:hypothetical protein OH820_10885 [Streptomyces sp. NBC_00857]
MTRIHSVLTGLAAAVAATTLGLGVASQATATPAANPQRTAAHPAAVSAAADLPIHRGKYWTLGGCQEAGQQGIDRGHWSRYQCAKGTLQYSLWTDR